MIDTQRFPAKGAMGAGIEKTCAVPISPAAAFRMFTTSEGWRAMLDVDATIELAIGGRFEILFDMDQPAGKRGSEGCQVLAWVPDELIVFSWNAPPHLSTRAENAWVAVFFTEDGKGTRVRLRHVGFGAGPVWAETQAYFDRAWGKVLEKLALAT